LKERLLTSDVDEKIVDMVRWKKRTG